MVNIVIAYLIDAIMNSSNKEIENIYLRNQVNSYEQEMAMLDQRSETVRALRHDMKIHLSEIAALVKRGDSEGVKDYIQRMNLELQEATPLVDTGNPGIDIVLNCMIQKAYDSGIQVDYKVTVPQDLHLSVWDMTIVLGNLFENAIEANSVVETPQIRLMLGYLNNSLIIEISNTFSTRVVFKNGLPISTKTSSEPHGIGLKNVCKVLEKYEHSFDIDCTNEWYTTRIMMQL